MTTMFIPRHVVNLSAGGRLHRMEGLYTPASQLPEIFTGLAESGLASLTIYFHSGVKNEQLGRALGEHYHQIIGDRCASYPVLVIWETGVFETIRSRLLEIYSQSSLFGYLVGKLLPDRRRGYLSAAVFSPSELQAKHAKHSPIGKLDGRNEHG